MPSLCDVKYKVEVCSKIKTIFFENETVHLLSVIVVETTTPEHRWTQPELPEGGQKLLEPGGRFIKFFSRGVPPPEKNFATPE